MGERYRSYSYKVNFDSEFKSKEEAVTTELKQILQDIYFDIQDNKKGVVEKLLNLIEKHPNNPQLKNYLMVAYKKKGDSKKASEVNHWIIKEHSNYLFGKLNLAAEYYEKKEYHKMPEVMGEMMEIQDLYPDRKEFHVGEVLGFNRIAILYFLAIGEYEAAESRFEIMLDLDSDHPDTVSVADSILQNNLIKGFDDYHKNRKNIIEVKANRPLSRKQTKHKPNFNHKEIDILYENGLRIDHEKLEQILKLPQFTLIPDLETIIIDSISRYKYFLKLDEEKGLSEKELSFPLHVMFLLGELKSENSLELVLEFLGQSIDFLDFWLGDHITESLVDVIYNLGQNKLGVLSDFMKMPGVYRYAKSNISTAVSLIAIRKPERRDEVIKWFRDLLNFYITSDKKDNVIDGDLIGFIVGDVIDIRGKQLLSIVEKLYKLEYIPLDMNGDFNDVKQEIKMPVQKLKDIEPKSIFENYSHIVSTWSGYNDEVEDEYDDESPIDYESFKEILNDVMGTAGRNDPCPCGSGKKFKKCCMGKDSKPS